MYAVIRTGGKQYRVYKGDILNVEKLDVQEGATVEFDEVLALSGDDGLKVGTGIGGQKLRPRFLSTERAKDYRV